MMYVYDCSIFFASKHYKQTSLYVQCITVSEVTKKSNENLTQNV